jgi:DNA topoisomerase VI subunit B
METTAEKEVTVKTHVEPPVEPIAVRVVVERETHRKKGTSSRGSRRLTEIDRRATKAVRRVTRALDRGIDTYIEHRDKSKEARKDGVIVDFIENVAYGVSRVVSEASPVIHDVAEAINTRKLRSQIRRAARTFGSIPFVG